MNGKALLGLVSLLLLVASCSSSTAKLTKHDATDSNRIVYGKIIDLNPESIPSELQVTYTLHEQRPNNILSLGDKYPRLEPKSNFFWIPVPKDATYFGIESIRFKLKSVEGTAVIRDDRNHKPLFGIHLTPGNAPVYIGDITIRSGTKKYSVGLNAESFDLKEAYIKNNAASAKEFLNKNGIDTQQLVVLPFKIKTYQQAKNSPRKNRL